MKGTIMKQEPVTLNRTNDRPITFFGEKLLDETSREYEGPQKSRWCRAQVYKLEDRYRAGLVFLTSWEDTEGDIYRVVDANSKEELIEKIIIELNRKEKLVIHGKKMNFYGRNYAPKEFDQRITRIMNTIDSFSE